jgi:hypothetical protein
MPRPALVQTSRSADDPGSSDELWDLKEDLKEERPREDLKMEGLQEAASACLNCYKVPRLL